MLNCNYIFDCNVVLDCNAVFDCNYAVFDCKLLYFAVQCACHDYGCRAGVCHPDQHHRQTALWPGKLTNNVPPILPPSNP